MKVLHVISSLEIGGAQRLLSDLLPIQKQQGLDVELLLNVRVENEFTRKIQDAGIRISSLDVPVYSVTNISRLRTHIKGYDVVHVHLFPSIYWVAIAAIGLKVKLVYTEHSTSNSRRNKWYFRTVERIMYERYDRIISISQQTQDALTAWLGQCDKRFMVINNGVDTKKFAFVKEPIIPKSLIMISRFVSSKDQETVIRAMAHIDKEATLRFIGDGENKNHCEELAQELGVSDKVQFLGSRSDIPELVASSYIGIQSSKWEGFGLTAVEMMAAGKPVIASNVDGLRQVVEGAGEIFKMGNVSELAELVNRLLFNEEYYKILSEILSKILPIYNPFN